MRTRFILPLSIVMLVVALTMGVAAAGAPPYPPDVHGGGGGTEAVDREANPADLTAEERVSSSGSVLFFLILPPIATVAFTDEEIGLTVDNRQEH